MTTYFRFTIGAFLICFFLSQCVPNSDSSQELSGNYFYRDEGSDVKDILCHLPNHEEIYSEVVGYNYDADFIVAAQIPNYIQYRTIIGFNLRTNRVKYPTNSAKELAESEEQADSLITHDPYYKSIFANKLNFWIISNKNGTLFGPLTKKQYVGKRRDLMIPENIQIIYTK